MAILANPVQTYYVPLPEDDLFETFDTINSRANGRINNVISVAIAADGTLIYYDHWEDGYDPTSNDTDNKQASTEIWGDGDLTNGIAPGDPDGDDILKGGQAIILENAIPRANNYRNPNTILFDGADRIQSSLPIAVTRFAFPRFPGSLAAGAVEVFDTNSWGDSFIAPVGEETANYSGTNPFEYSVFYDNDGFVDIVAGSTTAKSPRKTYLGSPTQLFHNEEGINGNTNKWVQIDLQGVQSNRDAIGARVLVTTADGMTQVREQNGGLHVFAQNSSRLHFGLGTNDIITQIEVQWPSGETSVFNNVEPNQILKIVEDFPNIIVGDDNANNLDGTDDKDHIIGLGDRDVLNGGSNNDSLDGGSNDDILSGGSGHDSLNGNEGDDTLNGDAGNDLLNGEAGNDLLNGNDGADTIYGGAGDDTINGNQLRDRILGGQGNDSLSGGSGHDYLEGGDDNDTISGNAGNDTLVGGDQDDVLNGGADGDFVFGGNGNDNLNGNNGRDSLEGEDGNDLIYGGEGADTISGGNDDDEIFGEGGFDEIDGGKGNDTIRGGNGDDLLAGGKGVDTLFEINNSDFILRNKRLIARGDDTLSSFEFAELHGGSGDNLMNASAVTRIQVIFEGAVGNDTIIGGALDDTLRGLNDADSLRGENGNDVLEGGSGNDTLIGGSGNDILTGGSGNDQLVFNSLSDAVDTITDFAKNSDLLVFSASGFDNTLTPESILDESQFAVGSAASNGDQRFIYDDANGNLFFDADGNGAGNQTLVANLTNNPNLTHDDIYIAA